MIISKNENFVMIFRKEDEGLVGNIDYTEIFAVKDIVHIEPYYTRVLKDGTDCIKRDGYHIHLSNNTNVWINQDEYKQLIEFLSFNKSEIESKYLKD